MKLSRFFSWGISLLLIFVMMACSGSSGTSEFSSVSSDASIVSESSGNSDISEVASGDSQLSEASSEVTEVAEVSPEVSGNSEASGGSGGTGTLSVSLTDAATDDYKAVYVTITEVSVCIDDEDEDDKSNWIVVAAPNQTYNLLELVNGALEYLGAIDLEAGHYTQLRMKIGNDADDALNILDEEHPFANYLIMDGTDEYHELKIPSGMQTGIKLVRGFDIYEGQSTDLILDFDAAASVVTAGKSGKWLLKPTIKVLGTTIATIKGTITTADGGAVLEGALVSAQIYDAAATDSKEAVRIQASTVADVNGQYVLYVEPGTYTIVAYRDGYSADCRTVEAASNTEYTEDFALATSPVGTVGGTISVTDGAAEQQVALSIRQASACGGDMEIQSINIANGGTYSLSLPVGSFTLVAFTEGKDTQSISFDIAEGANTTLDVTF